MTGVGFQCQASRCTRRRMPFLECAFEVRDRLDLAGDCGGRTGGWAGLVRGVWEFAHTGTVPAAVRITAQRGLQPKAPRRSSAGAIRLVPPVAWRSAAGALP